MPLFSANLGLLWKELSLPDGIRAAARAGFDAVECHWPYETSTEEIVFALEETNLSMLGLNTLRGDVLAGERGLLALPGRDVDAKRSIDQAIEYARVIGCSHIHAMAGIGSGHECHRTFIDNLSYAAKKASLIDISIVIEPLNTFDNPGYFLTSTKLAKQIIDEVGQPNLKMMFDCYHVERMEGDSEGKLEKLFSYIGHIQFASVPDRHEPDRGELDYRKIFDLLDRLDYMKPIGAEYHPLQSTEKGLGWMSRLG
jgi:hydroxypyruvate isomerase